jgi:hypothetical protein
MPANEMRAQILREIEKQRMAYSFKMLLLVLMAELADSQGRVPIRIAAERFRDFFAERARENKQVENPNRPGDLINRTAEKWETVIIHDPAKRMGHSLVQFDESYVRWAPRVWDLWSPDFKRQVHDVAHRRLREYFDRHAGGF